MAHAIQEDQLPWDPSVVALLPFPTVLNMISGDMGWTQQLGNAVLANRGAVMDAIQRARSLSYSYGYLRDNPQYRVVNAGPGDIEIVPVDPAFVYVPYYDPYVVFARPRPGFFIGGAITFGPRIGIGVFAPWGWGAVSFGWRSHAIFVNNRPWERTWVNRTTYVHPYVAPRYTRPYQEHHEMREYRAPARRGKGAGANDDPGVFRLIFSHRPCDLVQNLVGLLGGEALHLRPNGSSSRTSARTSSRTPLP